MTPAVYHAKAPVVEALQWTGENWDDISRWVYGEVVHVPEDDWDSGKYVVVIGEGDSELSVITASGEQYVERDGWLVKRDGGWECWDADNFEATFDRGGVL